MSDSGTMVPKEVDVFTFLARFAPLIFLVTLMAVLDKVWRVFGPFQCYGG